MSYRPWECSWGDPERVISARNLERRMQREREAYMQQHELARAEQERLQRRIIELIGRGLDPVPLPSPEYHPAEAMNISAPQEVEKPKLAFKTILEELRHTIDVEWLGGLNIGGHGA